LPTPSGEWIAQLEHGPAGPFVSRDIALQVAAIEAMRLRHLNRPARITVTRADGSVFAERCLCHEFGR